MASKWVKNDGPEVSQSTFSSPGLAFFCLENKNLPKQQQKKIKFSSRKLMQRRKNGCKHYQRGFQYLLYIDFNINLVFGMTPNQQGRNHKRQSVYII
jgi:hypothetical protein